MKKYNTPNLEMIIVLPNDCITNSGKFGVALSGSGDEWDWSNPAENDNNLA